MKESEIFGKMYVEMVRDSVLNIFAGMDEAEAKNFADDIFFQAYSSLTEAQLDAVHLLLRSLADNQTLALMCMTSGRESPWCIVDRDKATNVGLSSITDGLEDNKLFDWVEKYSEFKYFTVRPS